MKSKVTPAAAILSLALAIGTSPTNTPSAVSEEIDRWPAARPDRPGGLSDTTGLSYRRAPRYDVP